MLKRYEIKDSYTVYLVRSRIGKDNFVNSHENMLLICFQNDEFYMKLAFGHMFPKRLVKMFVPTYLALGVILGFFAGMREAGSQSGCACGVVSGTGCCFAVASDSSLVPGLGSIFRYFAF